MQDKIIKKLVYLGYDISYKVTKYLIKTIEYIIYHSDNHFGNLEKCVYFEVAKLNNTYLYII